MYLRVNRDRITGTAVVDSWPGRSDISDGKIEGDRFSFTLTGRSPWRARNQQGVETSGYPVTYVVGTVRGDEITYTFAMGNFRAAMQGRRLTLAPPADLTGFWEAAYLGSSSDDPKWPTRLDSRIPALLYLRVNGDRITGTAVVGFWPGRSDITDGKIEGDRFSLTLTGRLVAPSGIFPVMQIEGTVRNGEITCTFAWDDFQVEMQGHRFEE